MSTYKTPGVYVEEIATLPPSVAEVSTAVPAFIGKTQNSGGKVNVPTRISTLLDYETLFGKAQPYNYAVKLQRNPPRYRSIKIGDLRSL